ncbi:enoyl-CoA hydratase [Oceanicola sp. 22II-s10i]|uniref:enoyl-CoA hydratase/isomerase family protein n=1 Tax=Oceanicola sp. 22II-s10i TaxID=1317116 RepID=UPI000B52356D|nr:enoyl-CoA hydratase-related protein [Oceanicola sp. 22II-s10i]OWU83140.1 enoyl-CoA hydratase [Oceanicola sp. 22II-s10i]
MDQKDDLLFDVKDGIATVSINRPEARNALSISVSNGLGKIWEKIDQTPEIRVVILTSADCGTFCAGLDLKEAARMKAETGEDILTYHRDAFQTRMRRVKVPIIAAMSGHVAAGGMLLSLNSDIRVGQSGATIGITETKIGRGSPWGMPLVWMLPEPILMEMTMTGDMYPIEKLEKLGFINYLEPDREAVLRRAQDLAERIRDNAPMSVAAGKRAILTAMSVGADNAAETAWHIYRDVYASNDAQEGPRAFAEKRAPKWTGT